MWCYGSNTAGCLPDGDVYRTESWTEARDGMLEDMRFERDGLDYLLPGEADSDARKRYDSLSEAIRDLEHAPAGEPFDTTTEGTLPVAWWIMRVRPMSTDPATGAKIITADDLAAQNLPVPS